MNKDANDIFLRVSAYSTHNINMNFKVNKLSKAVKAGLLTMMLFATSGVFAQGVVDKIIAVIGRNKIILKSDLERRFNEAKMQNPMLGDSAKCLLLQQLVIQDVMLEQAERDSVSVTDEDVEGQLDNRLRYFTNMYGSKERLEQLSGKTVYQIKEEFRDDIRNELIVQKMQGQIFENIKITPAEVSNFYKRIPLDSLPFFPATIEVGQIVIDPPVSMEMDEYAHKELEKIRQDIIDGKVTFENAATFYTDDPGSRDNGGRYDGVTRNGPWAPEFVAAAFKLQNGEISPIFKTKFGYHIIQMVNRKGDEADLRHILKKPSVTSADFKTSLAKLDSIHTLLTTGKMSFAEAVGKFSTDEAAKRTGGMIADPNTGNTELDVTKLDPGMVLLLDSLKPGEYSKPHIFYNDMHEQSCRIVYLRNRTTPHKANLKDDYSRIQEVALMEKKNNKQLNWIKEKLPTFYLWIDQEYRTCNNFRAMGINVSN